ncbi:MFS transporter [Ferrovibrio sp.]|uniref:MFS transporter n=1 Tax=Ferrovibrio sp. TaxID=1917215 RepID=UPI003D0EC8F6
MTMPDDGSARPAASAPLPVPPRLTQAVVIICFLFSVINRGLSESFTAFLLPLTREFAADRANVATTYSLMMLMAGFGAPLAGYCFDRFGALRTYVAGLALFGLGFGLAAFAQSLWQLYISIGILGGIAAAALGNAAHSAFLARWFEGARLSRVVSLVYAGLGIGTLLIVPLSQWLIESFGWRHAYLSLSILPFLALLLLMLLDWRRAQAGSPVWQAARQRIAGGSGGQQDWTMRKALREPAFWGLASVFFFTGSGMFSVMVQGVAYLVELGYPPLKAASVYGLVGILTPVGIVGFAWADGRIGRHASALISYIFSLAGLAALWALQFHFNTVLLAIFALGVGLSFGARGPMVSATAARIFQGRRLGQIFGTVMLGSGLGIASGSFFGALLHDLTGSYNAVFVYSGICVVLGALPFWTYRALRDAA